MIRICIGASKIETKTRFVFSYELECHILKLFNLYQGGANGGAPYKPFPSQFVAKMERTWVFDSTSVHHKSVQSFHVHVSWIYNIHDLLSAWICWYIKYWEHPMVREMKHVFKCICKRIPILTICSRFKIPTPKHPFWF